MADAAVAAAPAGSGSASAPAPAPAAAAPVTPAANATPSLLTPEAPKANQPEAPKDQKPTDTKPAEIKLTLPKDSLLTQAQVDKIAAISRERGLSQEAATAVMEAQAAQLKEFADTSVKQYEERIKARNVEWDKAIKAHPEFGESTGRLKEWGEGSHAVLMKYGGKEAVDLLVSEGLHKHPVVANMLWNIHKASKPDKIVAPHAAAVAPNSKSVAESLFPSAVKK